MDIDGGPELIDETGYNNDVQESSVKTGVSRRGLVILGAFLAIGLFGLVRLGSDPNAGDNDTSIDIQQTEEDRSDTDEPESTSTRQTVAPEPVRSVDLETFDGPLFDNSIGYSLILGGDAPLARVNLDTGVVTTFTRRGTPVLVSGEYLVVQSLMDGGVEAVPLGDLDAEGRVFGTDDQGVNVTRGSVPGTVWTMPWSDVGEATLIDVATGDVLDRIDLSRSSIAVLYTPFGVANGFDLVNGAAGGVYQRADGAFTRLFDGHAVAVGDRLMLLETCDDALICRTDWYDIATREPVDLPAIDPGLDTYLTGGDRWAVVVTPPNWEPHVVEVETGRIVDVGASAGNYGPEGIAISPDGNWLATRSNGITVINLNTGEKVELSQEGRAVGRGQYWQMSFVPNELFD